ncbi:MAG: hypothetical protein ACC661_02005 [Verrucomicrobiales bacterium]
MNESALSTKRIGELLNALNTELAACAVVGELYLVGGAVMCLAFNARASTKDIDAHFAPKNRIREAARSVGEKEGVGEDWLNDAVKGFLSENGDYTKYLSLSNLNVFIAKPEYLLAMKSLAMRLGPEFHDESDVRYLLRYLNIEKYEDALSVIAKYYPLERFPQKTLYALEEILGDTR